jgi:hypothetical protein
MPKNPVSTSTVTSELKCTPDCLNNLKSWQLPSAKDVQIISRVVLLTAGWDFKVCRFFSPLHQKSDNSRKCYRTRRFNLYQYTIIEIFIGV